MVYPQGMPKRLRIPWEYCECGCKSSYASLGGAYFGYFDDLRGGLWFSTSHHPYLSGTKVASMGEINRRVYKALKAQIQSLTQQLSELESL
jgi:hypothetical protein